MKRPLALVGFTYLLTQAVSVFLGARGALFLGLACLLAGLLLLLLRRKGRDFVLPAAAFTAAAACLLFAFASVPYVQAAESYAGKTVQLSGTVCEEPDASSGRVHYVLQVESCAGRTDNLLTGKKIRLTSGESFSAGAFDRVTGWVHLSALPGSGYFSTKNRSLAEGTVLQGYLNPFAAYQVWAGAPAGVHGWFYRAHRRLLECFADNLPAPEDALVSGVLAGEKQNVPTAVKTAFRGAGVSHLMCVSGLHMTAVAGLLLLLLRLLPLTHRLRSILAGAGIVLFMGITGFTPSVMRSGLMYLVMLLGSCFYRRADGLNSLGFAVLLLCMANPFAAADVSLLLSASATLGILLFSPAVSRFVLRHSRGGLQRKVLSYFASTVFMSLAAMLFTLPVSLLAFNEVSLVSPLSNLLVLTPSSIMVYTGFLAAGFSLVPLFGGAAALFWRLTQALARYLICSTSWCASLPFAELPTDFRFVRLWLSAALLLLGCLCFLCRRHTKLPLRLTALLCVVMLLANSFVYELRSPQMKVTVAASAEGVSVVVSYARHGAVIGCGADSSQTALILRRCGVRHLDTVMLLSLSNRESQQAAEIITAYHPSAVVLPSGEALDGLLQESLACAGQYWIAGAQAQVSLWNCSASVTFESGTASLLAEDFSALICGDSADLRRCLPGKTQALICSSLPKGEERLQTSLTVLCRYPNTLKTYSTARRGMPVIAGGGEDLVLQPMKDGSVKIGRND